MFDVDGRLWSFLDTMTDVFLLNVLFVVFSIPLVTFGASKAALISQLKSVMLGEGEGVFRGFYSSFCRHFKQATIKWILYLLSMALIGLNVFSLTQIHLGGLTVVLSMATSVVFFLVNGTFLYALYLDTTLKKGLALSVAYFPKTLAMMIIEALPLILIFFFTHYVFYVLTVYVVIGFALGTLIILKGTGE